jgi:hypothetical protein
VRLIFFASLREVAPRKERSHAKSQRLKETPRALVKSIASMRYSVAYWYFFPRVRRDNCSAESSFTIGLIVALKFYEKGGENESINNRNHRVLCAGGNRRDCVQRLDVHIEQTD